jgi:predicted phosphoadenosine phosphosulfate sulfurtransferase
VIRAVSDLDVVTAARQRIINVFKNGLPVYLSFSGGKDSLCLSRLVIDLIQEGKIDPSQLTVLFVDEEAIFPCIEKTVYDWRKRFLLSGAKFIWYCVEVKHFNCFNALTNDETFICWDSQKENVWVRKPPEFAVREHLILKKRIDSYQDWLARMCADGITIVGIRTAESIQRLKNIALMNYSGRKITAKRHIFPIYDWRDNDVWLYLLEKAVNIPDIYLYLWQSGTGKNRLRVSQFFSVDTARVLVKMNEYYPDLLERVIKREPNAYLAALYWDSEMFGRNSRARKRLEGNTDRDYKSELLKLFGNMDIYFDTPRKKYIAKTYKNFFISVSAIWIYILTLRVKNISLRHIKIFL